jgi:type I restriction enzyme S subunit
MSELPPGWVWTDTGTVTEVQGGIQKQPKRRPTVHRYPFLRVANVLRGRLDLREVHEIELFDGELEKFRLRVGDLLVVEGNGSPDQIGRAACWHGDIEDCVHQNHLIRVRPAAAAIDSKYLTYYWNASRTTEYLRSIASSTSGLYVLTAAKVRGVRIPMPPLEEQRRIVAAIEEQFSRLDAGIAALERVRKNLQRARAAVLEELTWTDIDGSRQSLPLGSLIEDARTGLDRGRVRQRTQPPGYGYVKMADVRDGTVDLSAISYVDASPDEVAVGELRDGDILFNNRNSRELVGKSGLVVSPSAGTLYNNNLVRLRMGKEILPRFMALQLCSPTVLRQLDRMKSATTNVAAIYTRDLLTLRVNRPSLATQRTALEAAAHQLAAIGHVGSALTISEQRAMRLRSSILAAAFSGNLVVQDPTEESASSLLGRLAAEDASSSRRNPARTRKPRKLQEKAVI